MDHARDKKFLFIMAALAEAFGQEVTEMKIQIYAKALADLPVEQIEKAAWTLINTRGTASFPKVSELRDAINGSAADRAVLAVNMIEEATSAGPYKSIVFDDPYIHAVIAQMGGWEHFCAVSSTPEWKFFRKEIEKAYSAMIKRPITDFNVPLRLAGTIERENSAAGYSDKTYRIEYVGDRDGIRLWRSKMAILEDQRKQALPQGVSGLLDLIGGAP